MAAIPRAVGRWWRRLTGPQRSVSVVFSPRYRLDVSGLAQDPERSEKILAFVADEGLLRPEAVQAPPAIPFKALCRVHSLAYLESLGNVEALTRVIGVRLGEADRDRVVEIQRHMAGGTRLAARLARRHGGVAFNVGGGLHHAFRDRGERFCLLNDVAAAIAEERHAGFHDPVLVVDLDLHDGDGTRNIFAADDTVHTFSIHNGSSGTDPDAAASTSIELGSGIDDGTYLSTLHEHLPPVVAAVRPRLVFYVAGTDVAADDSLGDWKLSADGIFERDRYVTELLRGGSRGGDGPPPLVVVLGGGYGRESWRYSARYLAWLLSGEALEPPSSEEATLARYRRTARLFRPEELRGDDAGSGDGDADWGLTEEDVLGPLAGSGGRHRFLDYYSPHGAELALERTGFLDRVRRLGFPQPTLELDLDNPAGETVRMYGAPDRQELLMELRVRRDRAVLPGFELLRIEWLLLQNPRVGFTRERPRLPGQRHPGLGLLEDVVALLILVCDRLDLDGLYFIPSHYHLAAQSRRFLRFLEPRHEALFRELERLVDHLPLATATGLVDEDGLEHADGTPFELPNMAMALPVSDRLRERLMGDEYEAAVEAAEPAWQLRLREG